MTKIVENALVIYTDGSCHPKGRKGGFGILFLHYDDIGNETELDDYVAPSLKGTTSQRMELEACVTALKKAPTMDCYERVYSVVIRTDSRYVSDYYYSALTHWRNNKWCNRHGKPVDNTDLWREFVRAYEKIRKPKTIEWVKGHGKGLQKDPHNYTADKLAKASSRNPLTRSEYRASVRRKTSPHKTEVGSIGRMVNSCEFALSRMNGSGFKKSGNTGAKSCRRIVLTTRTLIGCTQTSTCGTVTTTKCC